MKQAILTMAILLSACDGGEEPPTSKDRQFCLDTFDCVMDNCANTDPMNPSEFENCRIECAFRDADFCDQLNEDTPCGAGAGDATGCIHGTVPGACEAPGCDQF